MLIPPDDALFEFPQANEVIIYIITIVYSPHFSSFISSSCTYL